MVDLYEDNLSSLIVVSIVESRAREVCICKMNIAQVSSWTDFLLSFLRFEVHFGNIHRLWQPFLQRNSHVVTRDFSRWGCHWSQIILSAILNLVFPQILLHDSCREKVLSKNIESGLKRYSKIIFLPGKVISDFWWLFPRIFISILQRTLIKIEELSSLKE